MTDPIRAALERLIARLDETTDPSGPVPAWSDSFYAALAALSQPAQPAEGEVTDEDLEELAEDLEWKRLSWQEGSGPSFALEFARAAIALDRSRRAAPVPVSERPWEREGWCDKAGRCWFGALMDGPADADWTLRKPLRRLSFQTVSLPAHALPMPAGEMKP